MGMYSTVFATILGFIIIINELFRKKKSFPIDILTGVNVLFFFSFVIPPFSIYLFDINISSWAKVIDIEGNYALIGSIYSLIGYVSLIFGYNFGDRLKVIKSISKDYDLNENKIELFAHGLGIVGLIFLILFIYSVGGLNNFFVLSTKLRSGTADNVPFAFIRNLTLFIPISSQIFYVLYKFHNKKAFSRYYLFFLIYLFSSFLLYFNRASRMGLLLFLFSFLLLNAFYYRKSLIRYIPFMSVLLILFTFYGKRIYNYFVVDDFSFKNIELSTDSFVNQFSFPFFTLTNAIENSFFNGFPRFFIDFILGILNLMPNRLLPFAIPKTITQLNSDFFLNGVPVDVISLGFYSFGISGVILITFLFGMSVIFIERTLEVKKNSLVLVFYIQFIFFFGLLVPYSGPTNVLKSNFCLLIAFVLFVYLFGKKNTKSDY